VLVGGISAVGLADGTAVSISVAGVLETAVVGTAVCGKLDEVLQPAKTNETNSTVNARNLRPITNPLQSDAKIIENSFVTAPILTSRQWGRAPCLPSLSNC
jgi:hypothetical protein